MRTVHAIRALLALLSLWAGSWDFTPASEPIYRMCALGMSTDQVLLLVKKGGSTALSGKILRPPRELLNSPKKSNTAVPTKVAT